MGGVIAFLTIVEGCNNDDSQVSHEHLHDSPVVRTVSFKELISQPLFNNGYNKLHKKTMSDSDLFSKTAMEEDYGFIIEDAPAKVIETDNLISYTLLVSKDTLDSEVFENLVVQVNKNDGAAQAVILKYKVSSPVTQSSDGTYSFESEKEITLLLDETVENSTGKTTICVTVYTLMCNEGGEDHVAGAKCTKTFWDSNTECESSSGGGAGGSGTGSGAPGESGGPSQGGGPGGGGGSTGSGTPIITAPSYGPYYLVKKKFILGLSQDQKEWLNEDANLSTYNAIFDYLLANFYTDESWDFAEEALDAYTDGGEVDFEKRILYTINRPCQKEIVKNVMTVSSSLTNLIKSTFDSSENVNLKFWNGDLSSQNTNAYVNPLYTGTPSNFIIKVGFDDNFLDTGTNLAIVAVTLHEVVHAYFYSLYLRNQLVATNSSYNALQNAFVAFYANANDDTANPMNTELHNVMNTFMNKIANAIYNYAQSNNISGVTPDYCLSLAWGTMEGTDLFEQVLTPDQQADANNIFMTEQNNYQYDTAFPIKGTPCQ